MCNYKGKLDILIIYNYNSEKIFFPFIYLFIFPICLVGERVVHNWLCFSLKFTF